MNGVESHLFVQRLEVDERYSWSDAGEVVVHSSRSPAKSSDNEDAALVLHAGEGRAVLAVADGVGGLPAGEQASKMVLEDLLATLEQSEREGGSIREALLSGLDRANQAVMNLGTGCATTLAVVAVDQGHIRAFHVGDSGVLAFGGRGRVKLETIPHSPVGYGVEAGLIAAEDALVHEDRHIVCNVVGDPSMHVGISSPLQLRPRDSVVLASDGLFDNVPVVEVVEALRRGPLQPAVRDLVSTCRSRMTSGGHADDLTLIAYRPGRA